jgi:hypothetical protein
MRRLLLVLLITVGVAVPAGTASAVQGMPNPSAAEFGRDFVATANAFARAHGRAVRFAHPDCVTPKPGKYMCSYAVLRRGRSAECHLIQANWIPEGPSTISITLSGRTARCENLRAALRSLV